MRLVASLSFTLALAFSCTALAAEKFTPMSQHTGAEPANPHAGMNMPADPHSAGMQAPSAQGLTGKATIKNLLDVPQFTYIETTQNGKTVWLAAPTIKLKKGDVITYDNGMAMTNFYSKSLKRNFESVIFVSNVTVAKK